MDLKKTKLPELALTADEILGIGKNYSREESPIDLSFDIMKEVKLAPLEWGNFDIAPKLMKISNTGMTAVLSGKWQGPRPFLTRGPISGKYVFSQLHFHWGRSFSEGSEHRLEGQALPLEAHVMFFKNVYESQDDAMKKVDGTVTIAYFFKLQSEDNESLSPVVDSLPHIVSPYSSHHMDKVPLRGFMPFFNGDYFMYWGNVYRMNVLWIICRQPLGISPKQLLLFKNLLDRNHKPIERNFRDPRELNDRLVFYVNPSDYRTHILLPLLPTAKTNNESSFGIIHEDFKDPISLSTSLDDNLERKYFFTKSKSLLEEGLPKKKSIMDILSVNLSKSPNVADFKYTLAKTLLELEKKENNDYGVLENYLKAKFASKSKQFQEEDVNSSQEIKTHDQEAGSGTILRPIGFIGDEGNNLNKQSKMNVIDEIYPNSSDECSEKKGEYSNLENKANLKIDNENPPSNFESNVVKPQVQHSKQAFIMKNSVENIYTNFSTDVECENSIEKMDLQSNVEKAIKNHLEIKPSNEKAILHSGIPNNDIVSPLSKKPSYERSTSLSKKSSNEQSISLSRKSSNERSTAMTRRSSTERGQSLSRRSSIDKSLPLSSRPSNERNILPSNIPSSERTTTLSIKPSNESSHNLSKNERSKPLSKTWSCEKPFPIPRKPSSLKSKKEEAATTNLNNENVETKSSNNKHEEETTQNRSNKEKTSSIPLYRRKSTTFAQLQKSIEKVSSTESATPAIRKLSNSEIRRNAIRRIFSNENNGSRREKAEETETQKNTLERKSSIERTAPAIRKISNSKMKEQTENLGKKMSERNLQFVKKTNKPSLQQLNQAQKVITEERSMPFDNKLSHSEIIEQNSSHTESNNAKSLSPTRKFSRAEIQKRILEKKLIKDKIGHITSKTSHTEIEQSFVQKKQSSERSVFLTKKSSRPIIEPEFTPSVNSSIEKTIEINRNESELKVKEENISFQTGQETKGMTSETDKENEKENIITKKMSDETTKVETPNFINTEQQLNYFLIQVNKKPSTPNIEQDTISKNKSNEQEDELLMKDINDAKIKQQDIDHITEETSIVETVALKEETDARVDQKSSHESFPVTKIESNIFKEDELQKDTEVEPFNENCCQQSSQEKEYFELEKTQDYRDENDYFESETERRKAVSIKEDTTNNASVEKLYVGFEEQNEDSEECDNKQITEVVSECDNKQVTEVVVSECGIESGDVKVPGDYESKQPKDLEFIIKQNKTGIKIPSNFEKPSIEKDKIPRNDSHQKSVTFAQNPTIVFDDSSEKEYNASTKQVNWVEDDKLSQMKKKVSKRMGKLKYEQKPEVKGIIQNEGIPSSPVKRSLSPIAGKVPIGNTKVDKEQDLASVRQRVQKSIAKLNKERQEYQLKKGSDKQVWKP